MTSHSPTRRHRSTPQIAPRTNFFPTLRSRARTYNELTTRLSHSPAPLLLSPSRSFLSSPLLSSSPRWKKSTRPGFQTADLFFHVAIYFFTPACTGWMRKESSKGEPTTTTTSARLSHPYFFLSLLLFSFYFPFLLPSLASHSIRTGAFLFPRSKFNDEWLLE